VRRADGAAKNKSGLDACSDRRQNHVLVGTRNQHDARSINAAIESVARAIAERHRRTAHLLLLGIANGGIGLAERLARLLAQAGVKCGRGTIDISFHRDDIGRHPIPKEFAPTVIPHDVNGAAVILVDDVLYSGRTVKAALDELFDHGRPERVELAVLVDRGGRRLPFAATYCGIQLDVPATDKVVVRLDPRNPAQDSLATPSYVATDRQP
jgi:pyrimidine operon attenuation protein/uracil phosphoribosyltransferase